MKISRDQMMPGHILEYRCPKFGIMFQWRVLGIFLGGRGQESLIEVETISRRPGSDSYGKTHDRMMVPEPMTRELSIVVPGISDKETDYG